MDKYTVHQVRYIGCWTIRRVARFMGIYTERTVHNNWKTVQCTRAAKPLRYVGTWVAVQYNQFMDKYTVHQVRIHWLLNDSSRRVAWVSIQKERYINKCKTIQCTRADADKHAMVHGLALQPLFEFILPHTLSTCNVWSLFLFNKLSVFCIL